MLIIPYKTTIGMQIIIMQFFQAATSRKVSRQVNVVPPFHPFLYQAVDYSSALVASGPCFTSKGILGKCIPFRQCYPYFKLPDVNNWDTWVIGMYDTCSYFTAQGRQVKYFCRHKQTSRLKGINRNKHKLYLY